MGSATIQRYVTKDEHELAVVLNSITSAADPRLKKLIKSTRASLTPAQWANFSHRVVPGAGLANIKTALREAAVANQAKAFRPAGDAPQGAASQPWTPFMTSPAWWGSVAKLEEAVSTAKASVLRAVNANTALDAVFSGAQNQAQDVMLRASRLLSLPIMWQREQSAIGLTSPGQMYLRPVVFETLLNDPHAWDNGQKVLQHEMFHLVSANIVDKFYRPDSADPDLWHRFLANR